MAIEPTIRDLGREVIYQPRCGEPEAGTIASFNGSYVFVRYASERQAKATRRGDLEWPQ